MKTWVQMEVDAWMTMDSWNKSRIASPLEVLLQDTRTGADEILSTNFDGTERNGSISLGSCQAKSTDRSGSRGVQLRCIAWDEKFEVSRDRQKLIVARSWFVRPIIIAKKTNLLANHNNVKKYKR